MGIDCCQLHCHSSYSFKDGLNLPSELVERAAELGQPGFGLTDHGVLFGAPALFSACKQYGIKGVIGMEAYEAVPHEFDMERDGEIFKIKWADLNGRDRYYHLTIWVLNEIGWRNLCELHTRAWTRQYNPSQRGKPLLDRASMERHNEGLMIGLSCMASRTSVTLARHNEDAAYEAAKWYVDVFGPDRVVMEIMGNLPEQQSAIRGQRRVANRLGIHVVATNDVHYRDRIDGVENGPHHTLVQARAFKKADTEQATDRADDGFGQWYGSDGFYLKTGEEMLATGGFQIDEITRSCEILDKVDFDFDALPKPKPPIAAIPEPGEDPAFDAYCAIHA
jgi:DNA polymerase-3 subunit alpha